MPPKTGGIFNKKNGMIFVCLPQTGGAGRRERDAYAVVYSSMMSTQALQTQFSPQMGQPMP